LNVIIIKIEKNLLLNENEVKIKNQPDLRLNHQTRNLEPNHLATTQPNDMKHCKRIEKEFFFARENGGRLAGRSIWRTNRTAEDRITILISP
jgi:hypothetical protein